jgi:hypothetical protein
VTPRHSTSARNREMYEASLFGLTAREIGAQYGLAASTVKAILYIEVHKRAVSPEPVYSDMRNDSEKRLAELRLKAKR